MSEQCSFISACAFTRPDMTVTLRLYIRYNRIDLSADSVTFMSDCEGAYADLELNCLHMYVSNIGYRKIRLDSVRRAVSSSYWLSLWHWRNFLQRKTDLFKQANKCNWLFFCHECVTIVMLFFNRLHQRTVYYLPDANNIKPSLASRLAFKVFATDHTLLNEKRGL